MFHVEHPQFTLDGVSVTRGVADGDWFLPSQRDPHHHHARCIQRGPIYEHIRELPRLDPPASRLSHGPRIPVRLRSRLTCRRAVRLDRRQRRSRRCLGYGRLTHHPCVSRGTTSSPHGWPPSGSIFEHRPRERRQRTRHTHLLNRIHPFAQLRDHETTEVIASGSAVNGATAWPQNHVGGQVIDSRYADIFV